MKYVLSILVFFSFSTLAEVENKLDPIIFMLDLSVTEEKKEQAEKFTHEIAKNVLETEPNTVIYQYYFSSDRKVFLYEVYKSNEGAIEHVRNFRGSKWESRFGELFSIDSFSVLGNSSQALKESLIGYTSDFRELKGGFHKPAESLAIQIMEL